MVRRHLQGLVWLEPQSAQAHAFVGLPRLMAAFCLARHVPHLLHAAMQLVVPLRTHLARAIMQQQRRGRGATWQAFSAALGEPMRRVSAVHTSAARLRTMNS